MKKYFILFSLVFITIFNVACTPSAEEITETLSDMEDYIISAEIKDETYYLIMTWDGASTDYILNNTTWISCCNIINKITGALYENYEKKIDIVFGVVSDMNHDTVMFISKNGESLY